MNENEELNEINEIQQIHPIDLAELPEHVTILQTKRGGLVYLIGTAHVSQVSATHVEEVIQKVNPKYVVIELCKSRVGLLLDKKPEEANAPPLTFTEKLQKLKSSTGSQALHLMLAEALGSITKDLKVETGEEFRVAFKEAQKLQANVILGDRPIQITFKRVWARLSLYEKAKIIGSILYVLIFGYKVSPEEIEKLKGGDYLTEMMEQMAKSFPGTLETIVHERDLYLANCLRQVPGIGVGVVGLGHVEGIVRHWDDEIDVAELCRIPETNSIITKKRVLAVLGVGAVVAVASVAALIRSYFM